MSARILLIVIDAATPHVVCPAIRTGRLPVMHQLAEAGRLHDASATLFPSITPAATTTIITGCYPREHGIAGASWFDEAAQEIAYYGDDFWVIAREGFGAFVRDFLLRLNGDRLTAPTLFEMVERTGRRAACLNYLVFRGPSAHRVTVPPPLAVLPGVPFTETVEGPSILSLGDFVGTRTPHGHRIDARGGLMHRFGMDDQATGAALRGLMAEGSLPELTVAYFADNDYRSHEVGPEAALSTVAGVDRMLGEAFDAAGGLDAVLRDTYVIVTSDHGHCDVIADPSRAAIRLEPLLGDFRPALLGRPWRRRDDVMICPNMRAAQIYLRQPTAERVERVAASVLQDPRVDQVMWRAALTRRDAAGYITATAGRGRLQFARAQPGGCRGADAFGTGWDWRGDASVLGLELDGNRILFDHYPNAFERIAGVLDLDRSGELWVTAKPGHEFQVPGGDAHVGGASHGALHALDSLSPLLVAGPQDVRLPRAVRAVDVAPLCMTLLGIPMRYAVGDPRP